MFILLRRQNNLILSLAFICASPCVTLLLMYIFFHLFFSFSPAAIQVEITPTQGEISVGDSKFFLCEGKNDLENAL